MFQLRVIRAATLAAALVLLASGQATATTVTFRTLGSFDGSTFSDPAAATFGNLTLTFDGIGTSTPTYLTIDAASSPSETSQSFGFFTNGNGNTNDTSLSGQFDLKIIQTVPSAGNQAFDGMLTGTYYKTEPSNTGRIEFSTTSITIGTVTYTVPATVDLVAGNGGITTIMGTVSVSRSTAPDAAVPEPASMLLLGTGLLGVAGAARRRLRR